MPSLRVLRTAVAGLLLTLALAGCTSSGGSGPSRTASHASSAVADAVLTAASLPALWAAYDKDNNAAIAAATYPALKTAPWALVDSEVILDLDVYSTKASRYLQASERSAGEPFFHHGEVVYAGSPTAYPRQAIVTYVAGSSQTAFEAALAKDERGVALLIKAAADKPWRMAATPGVTRQDLPAAQPPGPESDPTPADAAAAIKVTQAIDGYLAGRPAKGFTNKLTSEDRLRTWLVANGATRKDPLQGTFEVDVAPYGGSAYRTGADGNVRVVRACDGALVISSYRVTTSLHANADVIAYNDGPYGMLTGQTSRAKQRYLTEQYSVATLAWLPDGATPQLLGEDLTYALG